MPDSRGFHFDSNNVVKMHNTSYGKPRYIVEVFINSTDDVDFSANRISYRQSIKTSKPEEAPKIPKNVETHTIQRDSSTSHNTRFKTTIYLGPDRTSTIEEPPRCSKIQASQHKLIPYRKNCRSHHERVINQNSLLKLKHSNPNSIDHYWLRIKLWQILLTMFLELSERHTNVSKIHLNWVMSMTLAMSAMQYFCICFYTWHFVGYLRKLVQ